MEGLEAEATLSDAPPEVEGKSTKPEAEAPKRKVRKRPKLGEEQLLTKHGIQYIMARAMRFKKRVRSHKERGQEVNDLRKLLEFYMGWQAQLFPHVTFDDFVYKVEKLATTKRMRGLIENLKREEITRIQCTAAYGDTETALLDDDGNLDENVGVDWVGNLASMQRPISIKHVVALKYINLHVVAIVNTVANQ